MLKTYLHIKIEKKEKYEPSSAILEPLHSHIIWSTAWCVMTDRWSSFFKGTRETQEFSKINNWFYKLLDKSNVHFVEGIITLYTVVSSLDVVDDSILK